MWGFERGALWIEIQEEWQPQLFFFLFWVEVPANNKLKTFCWTPFLYLSLSIFVCTNLICSLLLSISLDEWYQNSCLKLSIQNVCYKMRVIAIPPPWPKCNPSILYFCPMALYNRYDIQHNLFRIHIPFPSNIFTRFHPKSIHSFTS